MMETYKVYRGLEDRFAAGTLRAVRERDGSVFRITAYRNPTRYWCASLFTPAECETHMEYIGAYRMRLNLKP